MGEARRCREAEQRGQPIQFINDLTNEHETGRLAPSVAEHLRMTSDLMRRDAAGEHVAISVPCNGCNACCYARRVPVRPERERPDDLLHLDMVPDPDATDSGTMLLRKREDGACIHLGPDGCSIYEHRPHICRLFDCRGAAIAGLRETFGADNIRRRLWSRPSAIPKIGIGSRS
jgi:hypothetical protein